MSKKVKEVKVVKDVKEIKESKEIKEVKEVIEVKEKINIVTSSIIYDQNLDSQKASLFCDGQTLMSTILAKNPYDYDGHQKSVKKFAEGVLGTYKRVIVFFPGPVKSHKKILELKKRFLNYHKKKRIANSKKLCSQSHNLLCLLLKNYNVECIVTDEYSLTETMYQYSLHDENNVLFYTKIEKFKLNQSNKDFEKKIKFFDKHRYLTNGSVIFESTIKFEQEKYLYKDGSEDVNVTSDIIDKWVEPVTKLEKLPKIFLDYKEARLAEIKNPNKTILLCTNAFVISELDNPFTLLKELRQALYHKLGVESVIEEIMEYNSDKKSYQFTPYLVKASDAKLNELSFAPDRLFKLIFHNLEKTSNVLFKANLIIIIYNLVIIY